MNDMASMRKIRSVSAETFFGFGTTVGFGTGAAGVSAAIDDFFLAGNQLVYQRSRPPRSHGYSKLIVKSASTNLFRAPPTLLNTR